MKAVGLWIRDDGNVNFSIRQPALNLSIGPLKDAQVNPGVPRQVGGYNIRKPLGADTHKAPYLQFAHLNSLQLAGHLLQRIFRRYDLLHVGLKAQRLCRGGDPVFPAEQELEPQLLFQGGDHETDSGLRITKNVSGLCQTFLFRSGKKSAVFLNTHNFFGLIMK